MTEEQKKHYQRIVNEQDSHFDTRERDPLGRKMQETMDRVVKERNEQLAKFEADMAQARWREERLRVAQGIYRDLLREQIEALDDSGSRSDVPSRLVDFKVVARVSVEAADALIAAVDAPMGDPVKAQAASQKHEWVDATEVIDADLVSRPLKSKKYMVIGGDVISRSDGERHYVGPKQLMSLYRVDPKECVTYRDLKEADNLCPESMRGKLIILRPDDSGEYKVPQEGG